MGASKPAEPAPASQSPGNLHDLPNVTPRPLRIGVDATCWRLSRGFGRHTRCLLGALLEIDDRNEYLFFADSRQVAASLPSRVQCRIVAPTSPASAQHGGRSFKDIARTSFAISAAALDAVFFPAVYSYVPVFSRAKKIVTMHDTTAEVFPELALHNRFSRMMWSAKVAMARRQADAIIAVSDFARGQIEARFGSPRAPIYVVGEAPDPVFRVLPRPPREAELLRKIAFAPETRAVVYLGGFSPFKNLEVLVRDFASLTARPQFQDVKLYLVGDHENDGFLSCYEAVVREVERLGIAERVAFTGYLSDPDVVTLLNLAQVLVLPSRQEGFGLPAVEAAACGCPVIATLASPLPTLLGDAARYIDPNQPGAIEIAMVEVLGSETARARMRSAGLQAVAGLDWKLEAERLLTILTRVVET